jgi:plastocyanin
MTVRWMFVRLGACAAVLALVGSAAACGDDDDDAAPATSPATTAATTPAGSAATKAGAAAAQTATVKVGDNTFSGPVTVAKGGKVTWDWTGSNNPHSVIGTSANARELIKSATLSGGKGTYEVTFTASGTYDYQCGVHGAAMAGKVIVE